MSERRALCAILLLCGCSEPKMEVYKGKPPGYAEPPQIEVITVIHVPPCNDAPFCSDSERLNAQLEHCKTAKRCKIQLEQGEYLVDEFPNFGGATLEGAGMDKTIIEPRGAARRRGTQQ